MIIESIVSIVVTIIYTIMGRLDKYQCFESYDVTAKLGKIYVGIAEYSNLLLSSERQILLAENLPKRQKQEPNKLVHIKKP